jgi:phage shock protein A
MKRLGVIIGSVWNSLLGRAEKPDLILDYAAEKFDDQLVEIKRAVAEVATEKWRIQEQVDDQQKRIDKLDEQARAELANGKEELALRILERKAEAQIYLEDYVEQLQGLQQRQDEVEAASRKMEDQIDTFKRKKQLTKAEYRTAEATARVGDMLTGINEQGVQVGRALGRIDEKKEILEARGKAIPELIEHGTLTDVLNRGKTSLDREMEESRVNRDANAALKAMKEQLGLPAASPQPEREEAPTKP